MTRATFVEQLLTDVPEVEHLVSKLDRDESGEPSLHWLMDDLLRFGLEVHRAGQRDVLRRLLEFVDRSLR